jgi:tetratricopeptide (TPR) repeat protein
MYKKALVIFERLSSLEGRAKSCINLGFLYEKRGDKKKAKEFWQNALVLYKQIGIPHMTKKVQSWLNTLDKK